MGSITTHFGKKGLTADDAIVFRLTKLGRSAKNWIVVTSDQRVQVEAHAKGAEVMPSEVFARQLETIFEQGGKIEKDNRLMSEQEVDEWLRFFGGNNK